MKMRTFALLLLATVASSLAAMPTKQELKQVEGLVQELMRPEVDAMKAGKKRRWATRCTCCCTTSRTRK